MGKKQTEDKETLMQQIFCPGQSSPLGLCMIGLKRLLIMSKCILDCVNYGKLSKVEGISYTLFFRPQEDILSLYIRYVTISSSSNFAF